MKEPPPPDSNWPRYSSRPFPRYRFVPGVSPHPRRDRNGHSYGQPEPKPPRLDPTRWQDSEFYLFGIDLYNYAYWWECHEALEGLWHAAGRTPPDAQFLQGIIQVAAANLKRHMGNDVTARGLAVEGLGRLPTVSGCFMGVDVNVFAKDVRDYFDGRRDKPALIRLGVSP